MADYDNIYGAYQVNNGYNQNFNTTPNYPNAGYPPPPPQPPPPPHSSSGVDIDTATIVSIASSCIILISGCIAVVCLIMYMKKTDMLYRSRTCAKCGAHVARDENTNGSRVPIRVESNVLLENGQSPINHRIYQQQQQPQQVVINNDSQQQQQQQVKSNQINGPIAIFQSYGNLQLGSTNQGNNNNVETVKPNESSNMSNVQATEFVKTSFIDSQPDEYFEDNEPTPYATFNLPGFDKDSKIGEAYETFVATFAEPPYMLLKKGIDCLAPPQYSDSVDYKIRLINSNNEKVNEENIYQSTGLSQCHSIASCSSNHDELIRAYEYGKQHKQRLLKLQDEFIESLNENDDDQTSCYRSLGSDHESPTDPGIREFTKSPPKPNEKRQGIVFHHQPTAAEMIQLSKQLPPNENNQHLKPIATNPTMKSQELSSNETSNSTFSSIPNCSSSDGQSSMKSNTVLIQQFPVEIQPPERAFPTNQTIKEGLSSDEDEVHGHKPLQSSNIFEDIYASRYEHGKRGNVSDSTKSTISNDPWTGVNQQPPPPPPAPPMPKTSSKRTSSEIDC
ncbi:hypothetical protein BLOT_001882 [Blomia tropicalis]|nr:hypothetical protein BLOT_001882 [Blomia tropicalis]